MYYAFRNIYNKNVTIEFTNTIELKPHVGVSLAIVITACIFFFIPTTLIVLGYYASRPTGTLISPLPQGVMSDVGVQRDVPTSSSNTIVAAPNESAQSNPTVIPDSQSNISDQTATISANTREVVVNNHDIKETSQIYLSNKDGDKSLYSVKSKTDGQLIISADQVTDTVRSIDYHIVNP